MVTQEGIERRKDLSNGRVLVRWEAKEPSKDGIRDFKEYISQKAFSHKKPVVTELYSSSYNPDTRLRTDASWRLVRGHIELSLERRFSKP